MDLDDLAGVDTADADLLAGDLNRARHANDAEPGARRRGHGASHGAAEMAGVVDDRPAGPEPAARLGVNRPRSVCRRC